MGDIAGIDWAAPSGNGGEQRPLAHCVPPPFLGQTKARKGK